MPRLTNVPRSKNFVDETGYPMDQWGGLLPWVLGKSPAENGLTRDERKLMYDKNLSPMDLMILRMLQHPAYNPTFNPRSPRD
jgi:hypothetical protein